MNESETSTGTNVAEQGIATSDRELLPLDLAERIVVLRVGESGSLRRHVFRRLERADVDIFYSALMMARQRRGQTVEDEVDVGSAELKLYERTIVKVEGYGLSDGRDLMELPNWKDRIPGGQRIRAVDLLMKVTKSTASGEELLDPECDVVSLDACWTEKEGSMSWYRGLIHRFTPPTVLHWKKFNVYRTRSVAIPGSRGHVRTDYPKMDGLLGDLYDELIVSVDGYSFGGSALTDRMTIVAQMNRFHKISAVSALFDKSDEAPEEEA